MAEQALASAERETRSQPVVAGPPDRDRGPMVPVGTPPRVMGSPTLLLLQRSAGNRAVSSLLGPRRPPPHREAPAADEASRLTAESEELAAVQLLPAPEPVGSTADGGGPGAPGGGGAEGEPGGGSGGADDTGDDAADAAAEPSGVAEIPLESDAAAAESAIDADAQERSASIRARAEAERTRLSTGLTSRQATSAAMFANAASSADATVNQRGGTISAWLTQRGASAAATLNGVIAAVERTATSVGAGLQAGAAAIITGVGGTVAGIADQVAGFATSFPLPSIPGLGTVRRLLTGAARAVADRVRAVTGQVQRFVQSAIGAVITGVAGVIAVIVTTVRNLIEKVMSAIAKAIATVAEHLSRLVAQIRAVLNSNAGLLGTQLRVVQSTSVDQVNEAESAALANVETNRQDGRATIAEIMEFAYESGDFPADDAINDQTATIDETTSGDAFDSAGRAAMTSVVTRTKQQSRSVEDDAMGETRAGTTAVLRQSDDHVASIRTELGRAAAGLGGKLQEIGQTIMTSVSKGLQDFLGGVRDRVRGVTAQLGRVVDATLNVVRDPLKALSGVAQALTGMIKNLARRVIKAVVGGSTSPVLDATALGQPLEQFGEARLASAVRMASPPLAIGAIIAAAAAAAAATIEAMLVILMWVAIIALILLAIYAIYELIRRAIAKAKATPKVRARPRVRRRVRRRRKRARTPLRWNPSLSHGLTVASGGIRGVLDPNAKLPRSAPIHGHHVWPKFVGGPIVQPLMAIRESVHLGLIHSGLNGVITPAAAAMGFRVVGKRNPAFILHLHTNVGDRSIFAVELTAFYAGINAITSPSIPPPAFALGLTSSFPRI